MSVDCRFSRHCKKWKFYVNLYFLGFTGLINKIILPILSEILRRSFLVVGEAALYEKKYCAFTWNFSISDTSPILREILWRSCLVVVK